MVNGNCTTALFCTSSASLCAGTQHRHQQKLQLFPLLHPLYFIHIDKLSSLHKSISGYQYVLAFIYRYQKLTRVIHVSRVTSTYRAPASNDQWTILYGASKHKGINNGPRLSLSSLQLSVVFYTFLFFDKHTMVRWDRFSRSFLPGSSIRCSNIRQIRTSSFNR